MAGSEVPLSFLTLKVTVFGGFSGATLRGYLLISAKPRGEVTSRGVAAQHSKELTEEQGLVPL